jgi:diguanylate cyclase (GGDEF)-like protein
MSIRRFPWRSPRYKISVYLILVTFFVFQVVAAVAFTGWVSFTNGQKSINDLSSRLRAEASARVEQRLEAYLTKSQVINQMNAEAIALEKVDLTDPNSLTQNFWSQRFLFDTVCGSAIYFGGVDGEFTGLGWQEDMAWRIGRSGVATGGDFYRYATDNTGKPMVLAQKFDAFDPRIRPWYQAAIQSPQPVWSPIFPDFRRQEMKISLAQAVYDGDRNLQGVVGVDCLLSSIGSFLQEIKISRSSQTFIIERTGKLVATSAGTPPFNLSRDELKAKDSSFPLIRATSQYINEKFGDLRLLKTQQQFSFDFYQVRELVQVSPFSLGEGLNWLIVVVVPEVDFMENVYANNRAILILGLSSLAIAIVIGILLTHYLVKPILDTVQATVSLTEGDWEQRVPDSMVEELSVLSKAINYLAAQLRLSFNQLTYDATHDLLTNLLNQSAFRQHLKEAIANTNNLGNHNFAVMFLDLDYFKLINDSLGHLLGDRLLAQAAQRLTSCLEKNDTIARFGGDEFVILLANPDPNYPLEVATKILTQFEQPFNLVKDLVVVSTSIGIAYSHSSRRHPDDYLRDADIALYHAKASGKSNYQIFDEAMYTRILDRSRLEQELRQAIEQEEFVVYYQPILDIHTYEIVGFEALVRWQKSDNQLIYPGQFIAVTEESGLILKIGELVMRTACQQMQIWQQQSSLSPTIFLSINVSGKQFMQPDFIAKIRQILQDTKVSPTSIKLEITESLLINYEKTTKEKLINLSVMGIQLSIDDFGTGYSCLSYLHQLPIHALKIDKSFTDRLDSHGQNLEVVEAIASMAQKLNIDVIAEGVETMAQLIQLRRIQCPKVQGYLFSQAKPAQEITELLQKGTSILPLS